MRVRPGLTISFVLTSWGLCHAALFRRSSALTSPLGVVGNSAPRGSPAYSTSGLRISHRVQTVVAGEPQPPVDVCLERCALPVDFTSRTPFQQGLSRTC